VTSYNGGDKFKVVVQYTWDQQPAKDYTVKIYSKQNLEVKDANGATNMIHMDGQQPSGFTSSTYCGMSSTGCGGGDNNGGGSTTTTTEYSSYEDIMMTADSGFQAFMILLTFCFQNFSLCMSPDFWA
jgi:hypothetical protein